MDVNQELLSATLEVNISYPRSARGKLENFPIAVFLLSYERGGGLGYSWLH